MLPSKSNKMPEECSNFQNILEKSQFQEKKCECRISAINHLVEDVAADIFNGFITSTTESYAVEYDSHDALKGDFDRHYLHRGIYGFRISKDGKMAIVYIGKAEKDDRLRQHLLSQNKNGNRLASTTKTKHEEIKKFLAKGFSIDLCLYSDPALFKATLSCIEIAVALKAKKDFTKIFPEETHWNKRLG